MNAGHLLSTHDNFLPREGQGEVDPEAAAPQAAFPGW